LNYTFNTLLISFALLTLFACQNYHSKKGDKYYSKEDYKSALKQFQKSNKHEYQPKNEIKIAELYFKIDKLDSSKTYYKRAIDKDATSSKNLIAYAQVSFINSDYKQASETLEKYITNNYSKTNYPLLYNICQSVQNEREDSIKNTDKQKAKECDITCFSTQEYKEGTAFSRNKEIFKGKNNYNWTKIAYSNLLEGDNSKNGNWINQKIISKELDNRCYDGPASYSKDEKTVYFSRSIYSMNDSIYNNSRIFKASYADGVWTNLEEFPFNSDVISNGHVCLSNDESRIYFTSNMPGGYGGFDLYFCELINGNWSTPENLGSSINSNKNELFPYVDSNDALFYSSDQLNTSGKLDVFLTYFNGNRWVKPETINYKLTATNNNFGFNFDKNNIENSVTATSKKTKTTSFKLNGRAVNKETRIPIEGALIEITTGKTGEQIKLYSDENGYFNFDLEKDINYEVFLKNKSSLSKFTSFSTKNMSISTDFFINYEVELIELNKPVILGDINFDCDKWDLTSQLKNELDKLIQLLNYNFSISLEIASHSDVSGDENYNKILTEKRSLAVVDYLISQGINKNRLSFKGYGEEQILNKCISDVIPCSDLEKQQNRRIEYRILSY